MSNCWSRNRPVKLIRLAYPALPELERYPESERSRMYRSTHKCLMHQDAEFRKRVNRFRLLILLLTALGIFLNWIQESVTGNAIWHAVGIAAILIYWVAYAVYVVRASMSVMRFQCERVGEALRNQAVS